MVIVAVGATVLFSGSAVAGTVSVTRTIKAQDKIIRRNSEYKSLEHIDANTVTEAKALIPKLDSLKGSIDHAATAVSHASATSSQKTGQRDWVKGARLLASGVGDLSTALRDVVHGKKAAAKSALTKVARDLKTAQTVGEKGDRLLHLPISD